MSNRGFGFVALAVVATLGTTACEISEGVEGNLTFADTTTGATGFDRALGAGATMVVRVNCLECPNDIVTAATSNDSGVFEVVSYADNEVTVRGVAPGSAFLDVQVGTVADAIEIDVAAIGDATIRLEPWPDWAPLPPSLWADGFAMLAGSDIEARAFPKDGNGDRVTGFGGVTWAVDGGASVADVDERRADTVVVTAPEAAGATFTLTPSAGPAQSIGVVAEADIASVELALIREDAPQVVQDGETFTIESDDSVIVQIVARTEDGTYVSGPGAELPELTIGAGLVGTITDTTDALFNHPDADPEEVRAFREAFERGYLLGTTGSTGAGDLTFTWGMHTLTVHAIVAPDTGEGSGAN